MTDRETLKERNLRAFDERYPSLGTELHDYTPRSELVELDDGAFDVRFAGRLFYEGDPNKFIEDQINEKQKSTSRYFMDPPTTASFDSYAGKFLHDVLRHADVDLKATFAVRPTNNKTFFLIFYGIGLGPHIKKLIERSEPTSILLIEPNLEFLYHSLETFDWAELFQMVEDWGGSTSFSITDNPQRMVLEARVWMRNNSPPSADGLTQVMHYNHPVFRRAMQLLKRDTAVLMSGLGFFYDETIMVRNAHANLFGGESRVWMRPDDNTRIDVPAFVIGSGPSIDKDIEALRANRDKAVYISCGTSIRVLLENGIKPDFHIEIENINVHPVISQVAETHDLKGIHLVTASTVDQTIMKYFDSILYYFRSALTPFPIWCASERRALRYPSPTVVNAGTSFAQECGFRKIYLYGADMGTKVQGVHHSKDSFQYTALHDELADKGEFAKPSEYPTPVPGNFGGTAYTNNDMYWTMDMLKILFSQFSHGRMYYNCSDGCYIEGALPQPSKFLKLSDPGAKRQTAIDQVIDAFPIYTEEMFHDAWQDQDFLDALDAFSGELYEIIDGFEDFTEKRYLIDINKRLSGTKGRWDHAISTLMRGTLWQMLIALEFYDLRLQQEEKRPEIHAKAKEKLLATLDQMRDIARDKLGELTSKSEAGIEIDPWD